jgi:hypothetical protein
MQSFSMLKQVVLIEPLVLWRLKQTLKFENIIYAAENVALNKP